MKAIMYHYVRRADPRFPYFRHLEVENFHTYFVGDNLVWVHNRKDTESEGEGTEGEEKSDNE